MAKNIEWLIAWMLFLLLLFFSAGISAQAEAPAGRSRYPGGAGYYQYKVVRSYPHDSSAFTQGLVDDGGFLYEGTGLYGHSSLRRLDLASGRIINMVQLPRSFFGEGIAISGKRILQLTWKSRTGFIYDKTSFELIGKFSYPYEGWGITVCNGGLIISDGSSVLHFWDLEPLHETGNIRVHDGGHPVEGLNELECVKGDLFANIWPTNDIAVINPKTGGVKGWLDLKGLLPAAYAHGADVLNGIAYDERGDRLFVTGKLWPLLFELELVNKKQAVKNIP